MEFVRNVHYSRFFFVCSLLGGGVWCAAAVHKTRPLWEKLRDLWVSSCISCVPTYSTPISSSCWIRAKLFSMTNDSSPRSVIYWSGLISKLEIYRYSAVLYCYIKSMFDIKWGLSKNEKSAIWRKCPLLCLQRWSFHLIRI